MVVLFNGKLILMTYIYNYIYSCFYFYCYYYYYYFYYYYHYYYIYSRCINRIFSSLMLDLYWHGWTCGIDLGGIAIFGKRNIICLPDIKSIYNILLLETYVYIYIYGVLKCSINHDLMWSDDIWCTLPWGFPAMLTSGRPYYDLPMYTAQLDELSLGISQRRDWSSQKMDMACIVMGYPLVN